MSPLLIAALARPICLPISILAGPSCIVFIAVLVLAMLADVLFIIAADAGDSAKAENIAAAIKIAFMKNLLGMRPGIASFRGRYPPPAMFPGEAVFTCCNATIHCPMRPEATISVLGPPADAARSRIRIAGGFAAFGSLALVDAAGEPVDQPHIVLGGTVHADEARADGRNQCRQQDRRRDQGSTEQDRHSACRAIRCSAAIPLIVA